MKQTASRIRNWNSQKSLLNQEATKYESAFQKIDFLSNINKYNLDNDYIQKQNEILKKITKEEVNAQIKKYITDDKINTVIVGDKIAIEAQLKKINMDNIKLKKLTLINFLTMKTKKKVLVCSCFVFFLPANLPICLLFFAQNLQVQNAYMYLGEKKYDKAKLKPMQR